VLSPCIPLLLATLLAGCTDREPRAKEIVFWGLGREGEVVAELVRDFERENPGIRVRVQQIPWSAAHEKLLTAFVGRSTPDLAQIGNTWIAEFVALGAVEPLAAWLESSTAIESAAYFSGIWSTNIIEGIPYGIPWYVDTRLLFYRTDILARAGYTSMPTSWSSWRAAMASTKEVLGDDRHAIFLPLNEWAQAVILGMQAGSPLLTDEWSRGAFSGPDFRRAFGFYIDLYTDGLAPPVTSNEIANIYQEFARGTFAMMITGPWNLGEFRRRLPVELGESWGTAPLPAPDGSRAPGVSLAGGSSLVLFRNSEYKAEAWRLIEFLSRPEEQVRFYRLTGDLPARIEAFEDTTLSGDPRVLPFRDQLANVAPTPKIPEWEQIAMKVQERVEQAVRGVMPPDSALARLDEDVERILEKRRWLLAHRRQAGGPQEQ
jgi:multiple sugar transport system substrate-binding protein